MFTIPYDLNQRITLFIDTLDLFEFGKDGPLAHGLRSLVLRRYDEAIREFHYRQVASEEHPEWNLAGEISKLRRYFEQIADGRAEGVLGPRLPFTDRSDIVGDEHTTLLDAKNATIRCYDLCYDMISDWAVEGMESLTYQKDTRGKLRRVDDAFKNAVEKTNLLSAAEDRIIEDLTKSSYEIWKETRRILYDFIPQRAYEC